MNQQNSTFNYIVLVLGGLAVGWLVGLSLSDVVAAVIATTGGTLITVAATLSGLKISVDNVDYVPQASRRTMSAVPVAATLIGLGVGATIGLAARTHSWLGFDIDKEITKWETRGLKKVSVASALFDYKFARLQREGPLAGERNNDPYQAGLYGATFDTCKQLLLRRGPDLRQGVVSNPDTRISSLAEITQDDSVLWEEVLKQCMSH